MQKMPKVFFYFSLLVVTLIAFGCLLSVVVYITAPEIMSEIASSLSEFWQAMPAWMRIGIGIFLALVGVMILPVCLDFVFHAPFGESSRLFGEDVSRDFYHGP